MYVQDFILAVIWAPEGGGATAMAPVKCTLRSFGCGFRKEMGGHRWIRVEVRVPFTSPHQSYSQHMVTVTNVTVTCTALVVLKAFSLAEDR